MRADNHMVILQIYMVTTDTAVYTIARVNQELRLFHIVSRFAVSYIKPLEWILFYAFKDIQV